jgi:hypothetical protein
MVFSTERNIYKDQDALSKLNSFGKKILIIMLYFLNCTEELSKMY